MRLLLLAAILALVLALDGDTRPRRLDVTLTAYTHSGQRTASGAWPRPGMCALSRDLERDLRLRFGATFHLQGVGSCVFMDRMHQRWDKRVDVFLPSERQAWQFGIRRSTMTLP